MRLFFFFFPSFVDGPVIQQLKRTFKYFKDYRQVSLPVESSSLFYIHQKYTFTIFLILMNNNWIPCPADDHWTHKSEASPWPTEGAILPASIHPGARAHWCSASSWMVGTSCPTFINIYSDATEASRAVFVPRFVFVQLWFFSILCTRCILLFFIHFFNHQEKWASPSPQWCKSKPLVD